MSTSYLEMRPHILTNVTSIANRMVMSLRTNVGLNLKQRVLYSTSKSFKLSFYYHITLSCLFSSSFESIVVCLWIQPNDDLWNDLLRCKICMFIVGAILLALARTLHTCTWAVLGDHMHEWYMPTHKWMPASDLKGGLIGIIQVKTTRHLRAMNTSNVSPFPKIN